MSDLLLSLIQPILDVLKEHVVKHICYAIQVGDNVSSLSNKAQILKVKLDDINEIVANADKEMKKPTHEVTEWKNRVERLLQAAESVKSDYEKRNCIMFTRSFNCLSNHSIGRRAAKQLSTVEEEIRNIQDIKDVIVKAPPHPAQLMSAASIKFGREAFEAKLTEAINFLRDDGEGAIGICGLGGVGKTTLLEHINNTLEKDPQSFGFDNVIWATASRDYKIENIQKQIAMNLGLPDVGNFTHMISTYLLNRSFVLLLDDVWGVVDLKQLGIPLPLGAIGQSKRRKLILTTRFQQVCYNMEVRRMINVEVLSPEVARLLFRDKVGEDTINSHPQIPELADIVAGECDGLPLAIIAIGRAMSGNQTVELWENAIVLLCQSKLSKIPGLDDPLPLLKLSYDYLKDPREQDCFLHCALWPEDVKISKENLVQVWMGHGLLGEFDDLKDAYNSGYAIIDSLQKACLLEQVKSEYTELKNIYVKLHDVIRDMALWIARDCGANDKKWVVRGVNEDKPIDDNTWKEAHKMSFIGYNCALPSKKIQSFPYLTTLILQIDFNLEARNMMPFRYFHSLKYLDLSHCINLGTVPIEICGLDKLEYLNLTSTFITSIPEEIKNLTNLKFLLLCENFISQVPEELLSNLVSLEVLDMSTIFQDFPHQSPIIHTLNLGCCLEGGSRLKALGVNVFSSSDFQKLAQLPGLPITRLYLIGMEDLNHLQLLSPSLRSTLKELRLTRSAASNEELLIIKEKYLSYVTKIELRYLGLKDIVWVGVKPKDVLQKLRELSISECHQLTHVTWVVSLPCLESLALAHCASMKQIAEEIEYRDEDIDRSRVSFPSLRILHLHHLPQLSSISDSPLALSCLEYLSVEDCPQLKKLPFQSPDSYNNLKLKKIAGEKNWWESLVLEDTIRTFLQPLYDRAFPLTRIRI